MKNTKLCWVLTLGMAASMGAMLSAQVQTIVPPVVTELEYIEPL